MSGPTRVAVLVASLAGAWPSSAAPVQVGLDVLVEKAGHPLVGRHIGVVAHAASVGADGRHILAVLRDLGVDVRRVFAPEHGLDSLAAPGEPIRDRIENVSGVPVVSLYGAKLAPSMVDLSDLDALVFDLQGAGVRFYTYVSTLVLCLEAAAEADIEFVVLDRPNPLGGELVAGPHVDPAKRRSFLALAPGPLIHGLTAGEMALFLTAGRVGSPSVRVVPMRDWRRAMTWSDTQRAWVPPSPNLRTPEAALAYPGVALLEATNVSEGRGTEAPFLLIGAPWLDPEPLRARLERTGFAAETATFTPARGHPGAAPKYGGVEILGLRIRARAPRSVHPYALGLTLLSALQGQTGFRWRSETALDDLLGTARVREQLSRGSSISAILASDADAIAAYREKRKPFLLYE
jgi:uncharacterized protein YbbC (DUF1343 family)